MCVFPCEYCNSIIVNSYFMYVLLHLDKASLPNLPYYLHLRIIVVFVPPQETSARSSPTTTSECSYPPTPVTTGGRLVPVTGGPLSQLFHSYFHTRFVLFPTWAAGFFFSFITVVPGTNAPQGTSTKCSLWRGSIEILPRVGHGNMVVVHLRVITV